MTDKETIAALVNQVKHMAEIAQRHYDEDDRKFSELEKSVVDLRISNSRLVGYAIGILGLLSLVSTVASIYSAVK